MQLTLDFSNPSTPDKHAIDSFMSQSREKLISPIVKLFNSFPSLSAENKKILQLETERINQEFKDRQETLCSRFYISENERLIASIEEKLFLNLPLTYQEVSYANENFWIPKGFEFTYYGLKPLKS